MSPSATEDGLQKSSVMTNITFNTPCHGTPWYPIPRSISLRIVEALACHHESIPTFTTALVKFHALVSRKTFPCGSPGQIHAVSQIGKLISSTACQTRMLELTLLNESVLRGGETSRPTQSWILTLSNVPRSAALLDVHRPFDSADAEFGEMATSPTLIALN